MTAFLTFAVQSLNITNCLPVQSLYVPLIKIYFICSIFITFIALLWFWTQNYYTGKKLPYLLLKTGNICKVILFWIFPKPTTAPVIANKSQEVTAVVAINESNVILSKNTCNKCEMCSNCKVNKDKEDKKKKEKEIFDSALSAINYMVFYLLIIFITLVMTIIWTINATN